MRLIDADKFKEWVDCGHYRSPSELFFSEQDLCDAIDAQPTVYNVNNMVDQLKHEKVIAFLTLANASDIPDMVCEKVSLYLDKVIEIIRNGIME